MTKSIATMPMMEPAIIMSLVSTTPVLTAMAFGGVEMGRTIAKLVLSAMIKPIINVQAGPPTIPDVARVIPRGISREAVTVLDKKFDIIIETTANTLSRTRYDI